MKRILAVFLTLAMALNIAPMAAFAAADSDAASIVAVEETDETSSPQLDEETAKAIVSDPFLQAGYARTEQEQTGQAEVDTSDVSIKATDSFGQLLVNGMEEQQAEATKANRILDIKLSGNNATVTYTATEQLNIVVAVYTDDDAQEMIASGYKVVQPTPEGENSQNVSVLLNGEIPKYCVVKGYMLDEAENAPLSAAYTNALGTKDLTDLEGATTDDFEPERVINLDSDSTTNFAVLKEGVARIKPDRSSNVLLMEDNDTRTYAFERASQDLRELKQGDILTYEKEDGSLIIAKVEQIEVDGSTVTIHGDADVDDTEVFEALKIDAEADTQKFNTKTTVPGVTELGEGTIDTSIFATDSELDLSALAQTNGKMEEFPIKKSKKFSFESKEKVEGLDDNSEVFAKISGEVDIAVDGALQYYIAGGQKYIHLNITPMATLTSTIMGEVKTTIELPALDACPVPGVFIGLDPKINFDAKIQMTMKASAWAHLGFEYNKMPSDENGTFQNLCERPVLKIMPEAEGSVYIGFDFGPSVAALGGGDWYVLRIRLITEIGLRADMKMKTAGFETGHEEEIRHGCGWCYEGSLNIDIKVEAEIVFLENEDLTVGPAKLFNDTFPIATAYASPPYGDYGWGKCPHDKYRVHVTVLTKKDPSGAELYLYKNDVRSDKKVATFQNVQKEDLLPGFYYGEAYLYLDAGSYSFSTVIGDKLYTSKPVLIGTMAVDIELEEDFVGPTKPDPDSSGKVIDFGTCGKNVKWEITENGWLTIYGEGPMTDYAEGERPKAWANATRLFVEYGVTTIGDYAFMDCTKLTKTELAESITVLGSGAFSGCVGLTEDPTPASVTGMGDEVFRGCTGLTEVYIPAYSWIGAGVYAGCTGLTSVTIPEGVIGVGDGAFSSCTSLKEVHIPTSLTTVGESAFYECPALKDVYYAGSLPMWKKINFTYDNEPLTQATLHCAQSGNIEDGGTYGNLTWKLTTAGRLTISGSGEMKFASLDEYPWSSYQAKVKEIVVMSGVENIAALAFSDFSSLTTLSLKNGLQKIEDEAFQNCWSLEKVVFPDSMTELGVGAFSYCTKLKNVTFSKNLVTINSGAFFGSGLEMVVLPTSLKDLGWKAFRGCTELTGVKLNDGLETIGDGAFYDCKKLTSIVIPDSVRSVGEYTFYNCAALKTVTIPAGVKTVENCTFWECTSLTTVTYTGTKAQWAKVVIRENNEPLKNANIQCTGRADNIVDAGSCGADVIWELDKNGTLVISGSGTMMDYGSVGETIYMCAPWYEYRDNIQQVIIRDGVTSIGRCAFLFCESMKTVSIPESVTAIGGYAFSNCKKLESIELPTGITKINRSTFICCAALTYIRIPSGVTSIDDFAFRECSMLNDIDVPRTVTSIGNGAFEYCDNLKGVSYVSGDSTRATMARWRKIAIGANNTALYYQATIYCADGNIEPRTKPTAVENSITTGTASTSDSKFQATFANAKAGKEYVVLVSRSGSDPLNADNLIYINQITADADGELAVPFITAADAAEMTYVVACAQDDAPVEPDQPGGDEPSSGDDGGGAAIILIGGVAAVAAVAGVVLMMPVKVEGTVKLADQPVANATVQVLKGDAVKAETVTDANGRFTVKVKRGGYTLRVQWTDASGQPVTRTVDFKAPNANLNVAA